MAKFVKTPQTIYVHALRRIVKFSTQRNESNSNFDKISRKFLIPVI